MLEPPNAHNPEDLASIHEAELASAYTTQDTTLVALPSTTTPTETDEGTSFSTKPLRDPDDISDLIRKRPRWYTGSTMRWAIAASVLACLAGLNYFGAQTNRELRTALANKSAENKKLRTDTKEQAARIQQLQAKVKDRKADIIIIHQGMRAQDAIGAAGDKPPELANQMAEIAPAADAEAEAVLLPGASNKLDPIIIAPNRTKVIMDPGKSTNAPSPSHVK